MRDRRLVALAALLLALALGVCGPAGAVGAGDLPVPRHSPAEVKARTREILARPEFRRSPPNLYQRARRWVGEQISHILDALVGGGSGAFVAWAVIAGAVALAAFLFTRVGRGVQGEHRRAAVPVLDRRTTPAEWRAQAEAAEAGGRWREALRGRYRALVGELVGREVVPDVAGRTTGEYCADVRAARPDVADDFAEATRLFELAWYGDRPTGEAENLRFRDLASRVLAGGRVPVAR